MKISILTPSLSQNCLGRAYSLAKIFQRNYEVEIIGPISKEGMWAPLANDKSVTFKFVNNSNKWKRYWVIRELVKQIDGDIIYASKLLFYSFGVGLIKKFISNKPLILDIDDWQMGFIIEQFRNSSFLNRFKLLASTRLWSCLISEKLKIFANDITVSNKFLKKKFGGTIIWHSRDTEVFNPNLFDKNVLKKKYNLEKHKKIVMFFGTPRLAKGIEDLIEALDLIKNQDVILGIVGIDEKSQYCENIVKIANEALKKRFIKYGMQSFDKVPEFLTLADVVVIPQKRNYWTIGQIPAKVFDAMAMAKPIISTNVSDLPEILEGCGWIIEPGRPRQLAESIEYILNNPEEAKKIGIKARQKCIERYSWNVMEKKIEKIFSKYNTDQLQDHE